MTLPPAGAVYFVSKSKSGSSYDTAAGLFDPDIDFDKALKVPVLL
jgi:hypothetical protein